MKNINNYYAIYSNNILLEIIYCNKDLINLYIMYNYTDINVDYFILDDNEFDKLLYNEGE